MRKMAFTELPLERAITFVEPGPVLLVTTRDGEKNNIMTITWHMMIDFAYHLAIATGPWNHSFETLMRTRECCACIPAVDLAEKAVGIGDCSGVETDKFQQFGLTALQAATVSAPLIGECLACLECGVVDYVDSYGFVILEAKKVWCDLERRERRTFHANADGTFVYDAGMPERPDVLDLRRLMADKMPPGL